MSAFDDVFDDDLLERIRTIIEICSVHRASISFQTNALDANPTITNYRRILAWETREGGVQTDLVSTPADKIFHIASITKILVSTAIAHAIEVKAEETTNNNKWSKFRDAKISPIRDVYNRYKKSSDLEMGPIPGNPTVYEFLVHSLGLPSCNDYIFGPDGTPLMELQDLLARMPDFSQQRRDVNASTRWTSYSNMNFAVIALMIEACWDGRLADFMDETLFKPLDMQNTSIGLPSNRTRASERWTVDQDNLRRPVQVPDCASNGAEAAALGAYSTAEDLDKFFSSLINASRDNEMTTMRGLSKTVNTLLRMENKYIDDVMHYTPFGLHTELSGSTIGLLSTSGLQFPDELFTRYPAVPGSLGQEYSIYYMAGSAIGCSCATALRIDTEQDFGLTVLTDTSGPVPIADHILRLVLRRWADLQNSGSVRRLRSLSVTRDSVRQMVTQGRTHTIENWKNKEEEEQRLRRAAHPEPFDVQGIFEGVGIPHKLHVIKKSDGTLQCAVRGVSRTPGGDTPASGYFDLLWENDTHLWLCVPPHLSIDRLDNGDWSNLRLEISRDASGAINLRRKRRDDTQDHYKWQA